MAGCFIVIDGPDASGKTTQTKLLAARLRRSGRKVTVIDFPRYGRSSAKLVENYLKGRYGEAELLGPYIPSLFFALDRFDAALSMRRALHNNEILISNRYVTANMAHQGGKIKNTKLRKKYFAWVQNLEYEILKLPKPDLHIFLHMPPLISRVLMKKRRRRLDIHEKSVKHLEAALQTYLEIAKQNKYQVVYSTSQHKLLSPQEINDQIWQITKSKLKA